jgi:hypothetical protein
VNEVASLFEIAAYGAILVGPPVMLGRLLSGGEGITLGDLFAIQEDPPWPRGVQEEEPVRWRVELLDARPRAGVADADVNPGPAGRVGRLVTRGSAARGC